ncbi:MAG: hypothetical protein JWO36_2646 [Myxococcales bacterium]|nr:hypothetical protein [Myxococcales bacterium]
MVAVITTMMEFDEPSLVAALGQLPQRHRVAFASSCAERLMPAYQAFSRQSGIGDATALRATLDRLWDDLAGNVMTDTELQREINRSMKLIPPDDEGTTVPYAAAAEDAASALAFALRCRQSGRSQEAARSAGRAYEALDAYVINREDIDTSAPGGEARVLAHPLIQTEFARQQQDLADLSRDGVLGNVAPRLRARANIESASFFGALPDSDGV